MEPMDNKTKFALGIGVIMIISAAALAIQQRTNKTAMKPPVIPVASDTLPAKEATPADIGTVAIPTADEMANIKTVSPISASDHILGSASAPVHIIVYSDFTCKFCADYAETLDRVRRDYGDKVVIAYRHFPVASAQSPAMKFAVASECAAEQGKFGEMYGLIFAANRSNKLGEDKIADFSKELGLRQNSFTACLAEKSIQEKVNKQVEEAKTFNITGSPTTYINGRLVVGNNPYEDGVGSDGRKIEGLKTIIDGLIK